MYAARWLEVTSRLPPRTAIETRNVLTPLSRLVPLLNSRSSTLVRSILVPALCPEPTSCSTIKLLNPKVATQCPLPTS